MLTWVVTSIELVNSKAGAIYRFYCFGSLLSLKSQSYCSFVNLVPQNKSLWSSGGGGHPHLPVLHVLRDSALDSHQTPVTSIDLSLVYSWPPMFGGSAAALTVSSERGWFWTLLPWCSGCNRHQLEDGSSRSTLHRVIFLFQWLILFPCAFICGSPPLCYPHQPWFVSKTTLHSGKRAPVSLSWDQPIRSALKLQLRPKTSSRGYGRISSSHFPYFWNLTPASFVSDLFSLQPLGIQTEHHKKWLCRVSSSFIGSCPDGRIRGHWLTPHSFLSQAYFLSCTFGSFLSCPLHYLFFSFNHELVLILRVLLKQEFWHWANQTQSGAAPLLTGPNSALSDFYLRPAFFLFI